MSFTRFDRMMYDAYRAHVAARRRRALRLTAFEAYWNHEISAQECARLLREADQSS